MPHRPGHQDELTKQQIVGVVVRDPPTNYLCLALWGLRGEDKDKHGSLKQSFCCLYGSWLKNVMQWPKRDGVYDDDDDDECSLCALQFLRLKRTVFLHTAKLLRPQ